MNQAVRPPHIDTAQPQRGFRLEIADRGEVTGFSRWKQSFAQERKDHRYYELVEETLHPEFEYRYFVLRDPDGGVHAIEPFFILDQDILAGTHGHLVAFAERVRRVWPSFLRMRTLMVGCVAGEGHLDGGENGGRLLAQQMAATIAERARELGARLIVLKEFPSHYRGVLDCFVANGFCRIPSMPMTRLSIDYANFDEYAARALSGKTRRDLRRKFRAAKNANLEMSVMSDAAPIVDQIYPLYLQVYEKSTLRFEKLTKQYFRELGRRMKDKVRFFVWRKDGKIVAFSVCMVHGDSIYAEYIGLDYNIALDLHLYHYTFRDIMNWAMERGYKWLRSGGLNYDPKFHLRHALAPVDLYVRHTSPAINAVMKRVLPLLEPTRNDATLPKFSNYHELWAAR